MPATGVDMVGTILAASRPEDIFGSGGPDRAKLLYHRMLRNVHPDRNTSDPRAADATSKLERLWSELNGDTKPVELASKRHTYELGALRLKTDIANVYEATYDAGHEHCLVRITRNPRNRDLALAELKALRALRGVPENFRAFHPQLLDSFRHREPTTKVDRMVTVTDAVADTVTLREVLDVYPDGIDGRDQAWIMRRLLVAVGTAHDVGQIHGAVVPERVLVQPENHGIILTDWTCSVPDGDKVVAIDSRYKDVYPARTLRYKTAAKNLDMYMLGLTMEMLVDPDTPRPLVAFYHGCQASNVPKASELLGEFNELIERVYGKRRFHTFAMPTDGKDTHHG